MELQRNSKTRSHKEFSEKEQILPAIFGISKGLSSTPQNLSNGFDCNFQLILHKKKLFFHYSTIVLRNVNTSFAETLKRNIKRQLSSIKLNHEQENNFDTLLSKITS